MIARRQFLLALIACATATSPGVWPQTPTPKRIGYLNDDSLPRRDRYLAAFNAGMRELGYIEGKDYVFEKRATKADLSQLPQLAGELVAAKVDLLMSTGTPSALALQKATREIPILIQTAGDPVGTGLAAALNRPGGNITGLTGQATDLITKRLDLLRQMLPRLRQVAFLHDPNNASDMSGLRQFEIDCKKIGVKSFPLVLTRTTDITTVFDQIKKGGAQALIVPSGSTNNFREREIIRHAARVRIPAVYGRTAWVEMGGLLSYAADAEDLYRRVATYAVKIFRGAKPGDLPIEQPVKFEMALNMKTAKALGLKIPNSILVQATKVIE